MRIVILGINFSPEAVGIGKYTGEMASWLATKGHEVRVITAPPFNPQSRVWPGYSSRKYGRERLRIDAELSSDIGSESLARQDVDVIRCPIWVPKNPKGLNRLLHLVSFATSSWPPMLSQVAWRPDIVLLVEPTLLCALQALVLARWTQAKAWLHIQDFEVDAAFDLGDFPYPRVRKSALAVERKLLRRFDRISTISNRMLERLAAKGVDASRCSLFPNWVDVRAVQPTARPSTLSLELGIPENTVVALYAGSMGKKQGLDLLVSVARSLSHRNDLLFVFCGEGAYRETLIRQTSSMANVRLLNIQPVEKLNQLLNLADIHLLPQRADAADLVMPSKLTGMLASGRPVIATASPGTQLASAVSGHGIVVPPGDVDSFVTAVVTLSTNPDLRLRLGSEARDYAVRHLDSVKILGAFGSELVAACETPGRESLIANGAG